MVVFFCRGLNLRGGCRGDITRGEAAQQSVSGGRGAFLGCRIWLCSTCMHIHDCYSSNVSCSKVVLCVRCLHSGPSSCILQCLRVWLDRLEPRDNLWKTRTLCVCGMGGEQWWCDGRTSWMWSDDVDCLNSGWYHAGFPNRVLNFVIPTLHVHQPIGWNCNGLHYSTSHILVVLDIIRCWKSWRRVQGSVWGVVPNHGYCWCGRSLYTSTTLLRALLHLLCCRVCDQHYSRYSAKECQCLYPNSDGNGNSILHWSILCNWHVSRNSDFVFLAKAFKAGWCICSSCGFRVNLWWWHLECPLSCSVIGQDEPAPLHDVCQISRCYYWGIRCAQDSKLDSTFFCMILKGIKHTSAYPIQDFSDKFTVHVYLLEGTFPYWVALFVGITAVWSPVFFVGIAAVQRPVFFVGYCGSTKSCILCG